MSAPTYEKYRAIWDAMTEEERQSVRDKAQWEHMSLWAVLNGWPSLRIPVAAGGDER